MSDQPAANTDRELYREDTGEPAGSYYENSVFVTQEGHVGMNVGGRAIVRSIADWHALADKAVTWLVTDMQTGETHEEQSTRRVSPEGYGQASRLHASVTDPIMPAYEWVRTADGVVEVVHPLGELLDSYYQIPPEYQLEPATTPEARAFRLDCIRRQLWGNNGGLSLAEARWLLEQYDLAHRSAAHTQGAKP